MTTLQIQVGALTRSRTYANDTKAQAALLTFYLDHNLGPVGATNGQKLDAIIDWITGYIADKARQRHMQLARDASVSQATQDYGFE